MAANNSESRKVKRRAVVRKNWSVDPAKMGDVKYLERKNAEFSSLLKGSVA